MDDITRKVYTDRAKRLLNEMKTKKFEEKDVWFILGRAQANIEMLLEVIEDMQPPI